MTRRICYSNRSAYSVAPLKALLIRDRQIALGCKETHEIFQLMGGSDQELTPGIEAALEACLSLEWPVPILRPSHISDDCWKLMQISWSQDQRYLDVPLLNTSEVSDTLTQIRDLIESSKLEARKSNEENIGDGQHDTEDAPLVELVSVDCDGRRILCYPLLSKAREQFLRYVDLAMSCLTEDEVANSLLIFKQAPFYSIVQYGIDEIQTFKELCKECLSIHGLTIGDLTPHQVCELLFRSDLEAGYLCLLEKIPSSQGKGGKVLPTGTRGYDNALVQLISAGQSVSESMLMIDSLTGRQLHSCFELWSAKQSDSQPDQLQDESDESYDKLVEIAKREGVISQEAQEKPKSYASKEEAFAALMEQRRNGSAGLQDNN